MPQTPLEALEAALGRPRNDDADAVLGVVGTRRATLADFPGATHFADGDDFACLLSPFSTVGVGGVLILALHLEGALRLVAPAAGAETPARFRALGTPVLVELARRLAPDDSVPHLGEPLLHEGSLASAILRTHAPREARILSAELRIGGARKVPALCYVLLDGKGLRA